MSLPKFLFTETFPPARPKSRIHFSRSRLGRLRLLKEKSTLGDSFNFPLNRIPLPVESPSANDSWQNEKGARVRKALSDFLAHPLARHPLAGAAKIARQKRSAAFPLLSTRFSLFSPVSATRNVRKARKFLKTFTLQPGRDVERSTRGLSHLVSLRRSSFRRR